ncbi:P-type ATPase [Roseibium sp. TrichSKD4]|nr:P-type ATPase [Roseibium sp. TrichSKD4]
MVLGNEFLEYLEQNNGGQIFEPEGFRGPNGEAHSVTDFMSQKQIRDEYLNIWIRVSNTR